MDIDLYPHGFEERANLRSDFIREIMLQQLEATTNVPRNLDAEPGRIPRTLVRYWHDPADLPSDVHACLQSWDRLADEGFEFKMFDDVTADAYIEDAYGDRQRRAFARCSHPAMRCDYLRLCFILAEGGFYVDADDVLLGDGWRYIFRDSKLKIQPLCYDMTAGGMVQAEDIWRPDLPGDHRIFYVNNDPIAAPPNHPVLRRALARATEKLLGEDSCLEIQATTGPGNLTAALAAHARRLQMAGAPFDFELLRNWDAIAEMRWDLSYRHDERNWRNVFGC